MKPTCTIISARLACATSVAVALLVGVAPAPGAGLLTGAVAAESTAETLLAQAEMAVSFALDQADRGEERYAKDCEECHGEDLRGGLNGGAPLRGLAFEDKYFKDVPASVLYSYMSSLMPPNSPGRYSPSVYADLMAYLLKRNGFQPGAPLPSDMDALDALVMTK
jgi:mono/diheme cytochrome c family protein